MNHCCARKIFDESSFSIYDLELFFSSYPFTILKSTLSSRSLCGNSVNYPSFITCNICCKRLNGVKRKEVMHVCVSLMRYKIHSGVARISLGIQHNWII